MAGMATHWLEGQAPEVVTDYPKKAYNARYKNPDILQFKSAYKKFSPENKMRENMLTIFVAQMCRCDEIEGKYSYWLPSPPLSCCPMYDSKQTI